MRTPSPHGSKRPLRTDREIAALPPAVSGREEYRIAKVPGLVMRVTKKPSKSWAVWLKDPASNRYRLKTLGRYPGLSLASATQKAREAQVATQSGVMVFSHGPKPMTFGALSESYLTRHAFKKKRSAHEDARKIRKDLLPVLGRCEAGKVTRGDIVAIVNRIADRGAGIAANRTLSLIRKIFNWAIAEGLLENNPALRIPMRAKEHPRERILDDEELARFWIALDGAGFDRATADVLRLQLLTGARIREIAEMHTRELDLDRPDPQWRLPPARSKSGQDIVRPLAPFALSIVRRRFQSGSYMFCCRQSDKPITTHAITRAVSRAAASALIPSGFTPHDLRRTAISRLAALGVTAEVCRKILGHAPRTNDTLQRIYNRHTYQKEMRAALEALEQKVLSVVETAQSRLCPLKDVDEAMHQVTPRDPGEIGLEWQLVL